MNENKYSIKHILSAICVTAIIVYLFMAQEPKDYSGQISELYEKLERQEEKISSLEERTREIKADTEEIISYTDAIYSETFPNDGNNILVVKDY